MKKLRIIVTGILLSCVIVAGSVMPASASDTPYLCEELPSGDITIYVEKNPPTSSFSISISDGDWLNSPPVYEGWCIDTLRQLLAVNSYTAKAYCSYGTIPTGLVGKPENLDLVNWVLNQDFVGKDSGVDGLYTFGDLQIAIWTLACESIPDDFRNDPLLQPTSSARIDKIVADAFANGEGFMPGDGELLAILLGITDDADNFVGQTTVITVRIPTITTTTTTTTSTVEVGGEIDQLNKMSLALPLVSAAIVLLVISFTILWYRRTGE